MFHHNRQHWTHDVTALFKSLTGFYLDSVAVDGLSSACDVHSFGALQDVVGHVAGRPRTITNFPPLLPVIKNLTDE